MFILKQLRRKKNVSQTEFAKAIGVSLRTIQLYERKNANIPIKNLTSIANYFGLDIADLYSQEVNEKNVLYEESKSRLKQGHSIRKLSPGKYLLSVPLVMGKGAKEYVLNYDVQKFVNKLIQMSFVVEQVSVGRYVAFEVNNNSMNNGGTESMPQGTIVLGKEVSKTEFRKRIKRGEGSQWIIVYNDTLMCKEILAYEGKTKKITCHSLNSSPEYPDFEIELDQVKQLFTILKKQVN